MPTTRTRARTRRPRARGRRRRARPTAAAVRAAALRAVERVLASEQAFALLMRRLEAAGWRIERTPEAPPTLATDAPTARAR